MAEEGKTQVTSWTFRQIRKALCACVIGLGLLTPALTVHADPATLTRPYMPQINGPAIWLIEDEDTELFLFGSVHALPPELDWQRESFLEIMNSADIVFFETTQRDSGSDFMAFFQMGLAGPGEGLHDVLDEDQLILLSSSLAEVGLDLESFRGQKPWFASLMIGFAVMDMHGQAAENGVETWMDAQLASDRDVRSLEDSLQVARSFSELTIDEQVAMLMDGLDEADMAEALANNTLRAWIKGDPDGIYRGSFEDMRNEQAGVYDIMITRRNEAWADTLDALMDDETGRILVVVGAGHLAGPESVILMMEERGWDADQF